MLEQPTTIDELASTLAALAHPTRLRIVAIAMLDPTCVSDLARDLGITRRCVYQHLATLEAAGIVDTRLGLGTDGRARRVVVPSAALTHAERQVIAQAVLRTAA